jgi:hypothetical protein
LGPTTQPGSSSPAEIAITSAKREVQVRVIGESILVPWLLAHME